MKRHHITLLAITAVFWAMAPLPAQAESDPLSELVTQDVYEAFFPNKDNRLCPANGFYTYDALIQAALTFPAFANAGQPGDELQKREWAAFLGQASHETTGGTRGAADQFQWGLCFKEEINKATSPPYYGRGPLQLTGQANYQQAGDAIGADLVSNPDLVSTDPVISWKTALWFWMTAQSPKPSAHDVIIGAWTPSNADTAAGRVPGYGVITNIINGGIECGMGPNDANVDRIGYYKRYADMFGVGYGDNLDCYSQQHF